MQALEDGEQCTASGGPSHQLQQEADGPASRHCTDRPAPRCALGRSQVSFHLPFLLKSQHDVLMLKYREKSIQQKRFLLQ